jgi:hypothetical protein
MPILPTTGFCISLRRIRQEQRPTKAYPRTVGDYTCYWNGVILAGLDGQIVEQGGPGDNSAKVGTRKHLRVKEGTYSLSTHDSEKYKTSGYSSGRRTPKPAILLAHTGDRVGILVHPGEDYLWSIGCLNPCSNLRDADFRMDFNDSRARVVAIIETMKAPTGLAISAVGGYHNSQCGDCDPRRTYLEILKLPNWSNKRN